MAGEERLPDGRLLVQVPAEGPGGLTGDGLVAIGPDHPLYAVWDDYLSPWLDHDSTATGPEIE